MKLVSPRLLRETSARHRGYGFWILSSVAAAHGALLLLPMPGWRLLDTAPEDIGAIEQTDAIAVITLPPAAPAEPEVRQIVDPTSLEVAPPPEVISSQEPEPLPEPVVAVVDPPDVPELDPPDEIEQEPSVPVEDTTPEAGIAVQFRNDFPHLAGAQSGCYGLQNCRIVEGQNYTSALREIRENLEVQGYELTPYEGNDDSDVRNHRIYEMRWSDGIDAGIKYLNVFGEGLTTVVYIITPRIITQQELQAMVENSSSGDS